MKLFPVLLATTLIANGAASDPGKVAIDFLEKVRIGKLNLSPGGDTALSAQTADEKKREIAKRLERMGRDLGSDPLEIGEVKMDENYAAVLIRKVGGFDPGRLQVFPVALVKHGTEWSAAPVPASFENVGVGYAIALRKRLDLLENWMLREQVVDLQKLRAQSAQRMREKIQGSLTMEELRSLDAQGMAQRFLTACEKKDLAAVLGLLGGLSTDLPEDWPLRLKSAERAISGNAPLPHTWRLMISPEVLRAIVHQEDDETSGLFSVAGLNPAGSETGAAHPRVEVVHFELAKTNDGLWRIDPPEALLQDTLETEPAPEDDPDTELLDAFPAKWQSAHPATPQLAAESLFQAMTSALQSGRLPELLALSRLGKEPIEARKACIQAAQVWWDLNGPGVLGHAMPLSFRENDQAAVGLFQFFSAREPDKVNFKLLYFEKFTTGWLWTPEANPETVAALDGQIAPEVKHWTDTWQQRLLADCFELKEFPANPAPDQEAARKVVENWLSAARSGDIKAALALTARLASPNGGSALLRNLGYEIVSAKRSNPAPAIVEIFLGKIWAGVGVKSDQAGKSAYPLYPVIQTSVGPRIVLGIDLFASRSRDFLNKTALENLQKSTGADSANDLRSLFTEYQARLEATKKPQKPSGEF